MAERRIVWASMFFALPAAAGAQGDLIATRPSRSELMTRLTQALDAFDRGSALLNTNPNGALAAFRQSRDRFQEVVDAGVVNGKLYYNLGNAHMRLGELGQAIAAYRRAAELLPTDEPLKANLRFARSLTRDRIKPSGTRAALHTVFFWHYSLPLRTRLSAGLVFYGLFWIALVAGVLLPRWPLRYPLLVLLVTWLSLAVSVGIDLPAVGRLDDGVLVSDEVIVRKGNGEGYDPQFAQPLHPGVEFKVIEDRGGWVHIELPDGNRGWVRKRDVELF